MAKKNALKGKGGWVAAAVVAVLGVWLFLDFKAPPPRPEGANPAVAEYMELRSPDVRRAELKREGKVIFALARSGDAWRVESPRPYRANPDGVKSWLEGLLENATVHRKVEEKLTDAATFGFDKPRVEVVLTGANGRARTLQVGKDYAPAGTPGTNPYYARNVENGRAFMLTSAQVDDLMRKKVDDLRDKRLLEIAATADVSSITAVRPQGTMEVRRKGEKEWELVKPFAAPADELDAGDLVSQLRDAGAESFVEDQAADLARYGLDRPVLTVQVQVKGVTQGVRFGKVLPDGKVYAARVGDSEVTLVPKATFEGIDRKASTADLRGSKLVTFAGDRITYLEVKNSHGTMTLQKTSAGWEFVNPSDPKKKKVKSEEVQVIIDKLTLGGSRHIEENPKDLVRYGLDRPQVTVTANDGAGTSQVLMLGKKSSGGYFVKGQPNAVFEVQDYFLNDLNVKPETLAAP